MLVEKSFYITSWFAWAPGLESMNDWTGWSDNPDVITGEQQIKTSNIPPMIKRRCSHLTKMAIHVATEATENRSIDYAIFCSQHGELNRSVELLKNIAKNESLSPTNFAQSVHNTSSGLFSIINKLTKNMNAIAAGKDTFLMGMIEALAWLDLNPEDTVLVTIFDDYMPKSYTRFNLQSDYRFALSFTLKNTGGADSQLDHAILWDVSRQCSDSEIHMNRQNIPAALRFLAWHLSSKQPFLEQFLSQQKICWHKKA